MATSSQSPSDCQIMQCLIDENRTLLRQLIKFQEQLSDILFNPGTATAAQDELEKRLKSLLKGKNKVQDRLNDLQAQIS